MYESWNERWMHHCPIEARCRQTKAFFPELNKRKAESFVASDRVTLSKLILIATGHNFFNYHQNIIDNQLCELGAIEESEIQSAKCDLCYVEGQDEEDRPVQTSMHIFGDCERFADVRMQCFGDPFPDIPFEITKKQVLNFLWQTKLEILPMLKIEKEQELLQKIAERKRSKRKK